MSRWIPSAPGSEQAPVQSGFVVEREAILQPVGEGVPTREAIGGGGTLSLAVGQVVEEHVRW
ncbi:MAG: hypothetical protein R3F59_20765 [Myxococcota bacterium]